MLRFLRKHSKWILAIFGTGLMIAFLIPFAIQNFSQAAASSAATWARIGPDEEELSAVQLSECQRDLQMIEGLGLGVPYFGAMKSPEHWYLLVREAEDAGLVGGSILDVIGPDQAQQLLATGVGAPREIDRMFARLDGVRRLLTMYTGAGKLSDRRMRTAARHLFHIVGGRFVMLEATPADDAPMPDDAAIQAQFEGFRDVASGEGEHGFGYRIPDRIKYEYLRIPRASIEAHIAAADLINPVTLRKFWIDADETAALPPYNRDAPVPPPVERAMRRQLFNEIRQQITRTIAALTAERRRHLPSPTGYYELPADWAERQLALPDLAQLLEKEYPGLALPGYTAVNEWLTIEDFRRHDLTMDWLESDTGRRPNPAMAASVLHEFGGDPAHTMLVQVGIMAPQIQSVDDGIVCWRVTAADPAHPADTLDEVRDDVVRDLQRLDAYEKLVADREAIEQRVRDEGLLAIGMEYDARVFTRSRMAVYEPNLLDFQLRQGQPLIQQPSALPRPVGADAEVMQGIIDAVLTRTPLELLEPTPAAADGDTTTTEGEGDDASPTEGDKAGTALPDLPHVIFTYPVEKHLVMFVMDIDHQEPLTRERYLDVAKNQALQQIMMADELEGVIDLDEVFGYDALAARHQFVPERRTTATDEDENETVSSEGS